MPTPDPDPRTAVTPAIDAAGLTVVRGGRTVLHDLTFTVPRGSVTGLLGPSGCGKTTLMRALTGVQAHVQGTLTVLGRPAGHASLRTRLGYVTQAPSVYTDLTVRENLDYFAALLRVRKDDVDRVIHEVDLDAHAKDRVSHLSGGQRARVSLAAALLGTPELLVLDEPTVGLDPVLRRDLWDLFHRLAAGGVTLLVSSHVMDEADRCQRLLLLRDGRLLADETPASLRETTGAADAESGFLALIEAGADAGAGAERPEGATRAGGEADPR